MRPRRPSSRRRTHNIRKEQEAYFDETTGDRLPHHMCLLVALRLASHRWLRPRQKPIFCDAESVNAFLGRRDLTLKAPDREYPSWLELSQEGGQLKAQMVGRWGNARPVPKVELSNGRLMFVSPKEEEGSQADLVFEGGLHGQMLSGTLNGPDGKTWQWSGRRAPSLKRTQSPKWGKPISLFNGKDLTGWHMDGPNGSSVWKVENGTLISTWAVSIRMRP
jgi:hypothetical protein